MRMWTMWAAGLLGVMGLVGGARGAEMVDNPTYQNWAKYKPGTFVTLKTSGTSMRNGVAVASAMTTTQKLVSVDAEKAVVEMTLTTSAEGVERAMPARKVEIKAKMEKRPADAAAASSDDKEEVSDVKAGTDTVEFKGRKLATTTQEQTTKMVGSGLTIHTKSWTSEEVPCGVVRMEVTREGAMAGTSKTELVDFAVVK
jgi:hypothetical protein